MAGAFLFLPLLARLRLDQLVQQAGYPGSQRVPATQALLGLLLLKLLDKEGSHPVPWLGNRFVSFSYS